MRSFIHRVMLVILLIATLISFYIFITTVFMNRPDNKFLYQTWQFPMLLALFLDSYYLGL